MLSAHSLIKSVTTSAGTLLILDDVSVSVGSGESLAIVGASGSGKSTLLGILAGLDTPTHGQVIFKDQNLTELDEEGRADIRAKHVGFVFQSFQLLPGLTALENVMMPLELQGDNEARGKAEFFLTRVGLKERLEHYPKQLSGGEQQRVAIARAFASSPDILFADEPTGNLDTKTGAHIIELLFELNREHQTTLVLVTHEARLAKRCSQRITLEAGQVIDDPVPIEAAQ
jgi:putative ABC transport system ATP-binding protein